MSLDPNLAALLTVDVAWQKKTGLDKNGQDTWASAVTLKCYPAFGSRQVETAKGVIYTSTVALYFDANDANVKTFEPGDKFTAPGIAGGQTLEAQRVEPNYSPGPGLADPMQAWLVEVHL